ncbi:MAG: DUF1501 domain-containing protein [Acidimicrobiales bacterium]
MGLTRRQFLLGGLGAGAAGAAGLVVARAPWETSRRPAADGPAGGPAADGTGGGPVPGGASGKDGILVLLTLYGGNDGLNTVIPYQQGAYLGGRPTLGYQPEEVIPLDGELALHPNLAGLKSLWDEKRLAIVRGVGYPNPNRSHFRSMDIWQSGVPDAGVATGWVGRWLDVTGTDPMRAVSVGSTLPRLFGGEKAAGVAVPVGTLTVPGGARVESGLATMATGASAGSGGPLAARAAQVTGDLLAVDGAISDLLASVPENADSTASSAGGLEADMGMNGVYGGGALDGQLALVARLVKAGSPTRVYGVNLNGFDTHVNEKNTHATLMTQLDKGVSGFFADLGDHPNARRVVLVAYSEFGRRVAANASGGTDHGTAAPVLVAGPAVRGGFYGDEPSLADLDQGDLRFTTDFRGIYATLLEQVVGVESTAALGKPFTPVPFL